LTILEHCKAEKSLATAKVGEQFQFEREGYFCVDSKHTTADKPVFNRTVTLRDTWAKIQQKNA
jgi:glutaminyl-tRNA synthetase